jgi:hypothetical protein
MSAFETTLPHQIFAPFFWFSKYELSRSQGTQTLYDTRLREKKQNEKKKRGVQTRSDSYCTYLYIPVNRRLSKIMSFPLSSSRINGLVAYVGGGNSCAVVI